MPIAKLFDGKRIDLIQNDVTLTDKESGLTAIRLSSVGDLFAKAHGAAEVLIGGPGASSSPFAYTVGYGLYGSNNPNTVGGNSVQIGYGALAPDASSVSIGNVAASASSPSSVNIGDSNTVTGADYSVTIGANTRNFGNDGIAIGHYSYANIDGSIAIGGNINCDQNGADMSICIGQVSNASYGSIAFGRSARAIGVFSIAIGDDSDVTGANSVAIGHLVNNTVANSVKFGVSATENINFDTWVPAVAAAKASTHEVPVLINGVRYNLLASNV